MKNILFLSIFFFTLGNAQISKGAVNVVQKDSIKRVNKKEMKPPKKQIRKAKILSLFKKRSSVRVKITWRSIFLYLYILSFYISIIGFFIGLATRNSILIWLCLGIIIFLIGFFLFMLIHSMRNK